MQENSVNPTKSDKSYMQIHNGFYFDTGNVDRVSAGVSEELHPSVTPLYTISV